MQDLSRGGPDAEASGRAADPELWLDATQNAQPVIDWYFSQAFKSYTQTEKELTPQNKKEIAKELIPIIKKIPDTIEQAHYVGLLARKLKVGERVIFDALNNLVESKKEVKVENKIVKTPLTQEQILVGLLTLAPQNVEKVQQRVKIEDLLEGLQLLYRQVLTWYNDKRTEKLGKFLQSKLPAEEFQKLEVLQMELESEYPDIDRVIDDMLTNFKAHQQEKMKQFYADAIAEAEEKGDRDKLKQLVKEFQDAISK